MSIVNDMIETALWSTTGYGDQENGDSDFDLDSKFTVDDVSDELKSELENVIVKFMVDANCLFTEKEIEESPIGHDLWLTIHRHGAGFWDGDYEKGEELTELCRQFEKLDLEEQLRNDLGV